MKISPKKTNKNKRKIKENVHFVKKKIKEIDKTFMKMSIYSFYEIIFVVVLLNFIKIENQNKKKGLVTY
jgi:hypothetical protein